MTEYVWFLIPLFFMIPLMAWIDKKIFFKHLTCPKCGNPPEVWYWVMPCFVETLMFMMGVVMGILIVLKG